MLKYKFYGTAAAEGIPGLFCECENCSRARRLGGRNIMTRSQSAIDGILGIDFSSDTYLHMLYYGFPANDISTYIITHNHPDHFYPYDFERHVKGYSYFGDKVIDVYVTKSGFDLASVALKGKDMSYVHFHLVEPYKEFTTKEGYRVTPLKANHTQDPVIYLIEKDGKCVLHSNDTGYYLDETWQYFEENKIHIDFAEFDCTMGLKDNKDHPNHMNFPEVLSVRQRLESIGCIDENTICVINHFTHNTGMVYDDFKKLGDEHGFLTSYDGFEVEF